MAERDATLGLNSTCSCFRLAFARGNSFEFKVENGCEPAYAGASFGRCEFSDDASASIYDWEDCDRQKGAAILDCGAVRD